MDTIAIEQIASMANITEVLYSDGSVRIKYAVGLDGCPGHEVSLKCYETPTGEFQDALIALRKHAIYMLEIPVDWEQGIVVQGASIKYLKGNRHVAFAVRKTLIDIGDVIDFKTPLIRDFANAANIPQLGKKADDDIDRLIEQARKYIAGERYQTRLPGTRES